MKRTILILLGTLLLPLAARAAQSVIIESEGYACAGVDFSRKQTEESAMQDARRKGGEAALSYIQSETHIKDAMLEKDLMSAYSNAQVKMLQELMKEWFKDPATGDCFRVKLKLEVTPDDKAMASLAKSKGGEILDDPAAPLAVKVWTTKDTYKEGETVKVFIKGNRPFYGKMVYKDAGGGLVQLLPNPFRQNNYFNGGAVYEIPSGDDHFDMNICSPFGSEQVTLYASTAPLGDLDLVPSGGVYEVRTKASDIPSGTRGIKISSQGKGGGKAAAAEFAEASKVMETCKK